MGKIRLFKQVLNNSCDSKKVLVTCKGDAFVRVVTGRNSKLAFQKLAMVSYDIAQHS